GGADRGQVRPADPAGEVGMLEKKERSESESTNPGAVPRGDEPAAASTDPEAKPQGEAPGTADSAAAPQTEPQAAVEPKPEKPAKAQKKDKKAKQAGEGKERQGMAIGCAVTLRGARMYEFLDRFISIAVPRMRDFRGLSPDSFDGRGNYTIGIKEQMIFPEIDYDKVEKIHGMDITLVTSAGRDDTARALLRELGMPFRGEAPVAVN